MSSAAEFIYTPDGWLKALSTGAKNQFLPFQPSETDTLRSMTIISQGCANGTAAGPVCDSITRVVLLSDAHGAIVVESTDSRPLSQAWQNGFGARAACSSLVSKFPMDKVRAVQNKTKEVVVNGRPLPDADIVSILRNWTAGDRASMAAALGVRVAPSVRWARYRQYMHVVVNQPCRPGLRH